MSFVDVINGKRRSPAAIFHKFRVDSSIHSRHHIFVEGYEDIGYYSRHVKVGERESPKFHICFGKKNLDKVHRMYEESGCSDALAYFIRDSDFDKFLGKAPSGKNIFLTCGYAVENYVCSDRAVDTYLRTVFCLDEEEFDIETVVTGYIAMAQNFHQWLSPVYGAAMFAASEDRAIDLNQLKVEDHFRLLLEGSDLPDPSKLEELPAIGLQESDFNEASAAQGIEFANLPALQWMRGKFLLRILTSFLRAEESEMRKMHKAGKIGQFNRRAAANLNEATLFDRLSGLSVPTARLAGHLNFGAAGAAE